MFDSVSLSDSVRLAISQSVCETVNSVRQSIILTSAYLEVSLQLSICHLSTFKSDVFVAVTVVDIAIPVTANAYCNNTIGSHIYTCNSGYTEASGQTFLGEQKQIITLKLKWNIYLAIWIS